MKLRLDELTKVVLYVVDPLRLEKRNVPPKDESFSAVPSIEICNKPSLELKYFPEVLWFELPDSESVRSPKPCIEKASELKIHASPVGLTTMSGKSGGFVSVRPLQIPTLFIGDPDVLPDPLLPPPPHAASPIDMARTNTRFADFTVAITFCW